MPSHHRLSSDSLRWFSRARAKSRQLRTAGRAAVLRLRPTHLLQPLAQGDQPLEPPWRNWSRAGPRTMKPRVRPVRSIVRERTSNLQPELHGHLGKPPLRPPTGLRGTALGLPVCWKSPRVGTPRGRRRRSGGPPVPAARRTADGRPCLRTTARGGKLLQDYRYRLLTWPHVLLRTGSGSPQASTLCCHLRIWFPSGSGS